MINLSILKFGGFMWHQSLSSAPQFYEVEKPGGDAPLAFQRTLNTALTIMITRHIGGTDILVLTLHVYIKYFILTHIINK